MAPSKKFVNGPDPLKGQVFQSHVYRARGITDNLRPDVPYAEAKMKKNPVLRGIWLFCAAFL